MMIMMMMMMMVVVVVVMMMMFHSKSYDIIYYAYVFQQSMVRDKPPLSSEILTWSFPNAEKIGIYGDLIERG